MAKCANCGRKTARTKDWACQWCGYPLPSGSYKKLPQTYQQVREGRQPGSAPAAPESVAEPVPAPPPVLEARPIPLTEPAPEPAPEAEPEPEPQAEVIPLPGPAQEAAPSATEPELAPAPPAEPQPVPAAAPAPAGMALTATELVSAYEADGVAASARFANQVLRVTGVVDRIEIRNIHDIYYITLTNPEKNLLQTVRCTFDSRHGAELSRLTAGQTVTVQGSYSGSLIDISIHDCILLQ